MRIDMTFKQASGAFRRCYSRVVDREPGIQGKVVVRLTIDETGQPVDVTAVGFHAAVALCCVQVTRSLRFPVLDSGRAHVNYPFVYSAPE